jgi:hypothetical protein
MLRAPLSTPPLSPPDVIDVEASGFGAGSYPIEVGLVTAEGERFCTLVRPALHWNHWDPKAASLHGIPRQSLIEFGRPVAEVARALNEKLSGRTAYSDAWGYDFTWLALLYDEAGLHASFRLAPIQCLLDEADRDAWHTTLREVEQTLSLARHRASSDALVLQRTWLFLAQQRTLCRDD